MLGQKVNHWMHFLSGLSLFSILFVPDISISSTLPVFQVLDLILPLLFVGIIFKMKTIIWHNYYFFLIFASIYVLFSMAFNSRLGIMRDYFEIYKIYKFLIVIIFFTLIDARLFLRTWIKPFFIGICLVNLSHFFNLFHINQWIEYAYESGLNIEYFGKNSLGQPAGKRMLGLMNNPNNNAILFSFFTILFFPFNFTKEKLIWFSLALLMTFLCQSRTSIFAILLIVASVSFFKLVSWKFKQWLIFSGTLLLVYFLAWMLSSQFFQYQIYGNSMFNGVALKSQSVLGRFEVWKYLWEMIVEKPFFGYGPNKDFFYNNHLYSENEYLLYAWRYGFIGVIIYLLFYFIPIRKLVVQHKTPFSKYLILIILLLLVTALTNNPLCERNILILFAISLGTIYNLTFTQETEMEKNGNEINT
jgi:O-antigen ligase